MAGGLGLEGLRKACIQEIFLILIRFPKGSRDFSVLGTEEEWNNVDGQDYKKIVRLICIYHSDAIYFPTPEQLDVVNAFLLRNGYE